MTLRVSDPGTFNDPFEVRPAFDQERHDYFASTHEEFYSRLGYGHSLMAGGSMVGFPTENAPDFGEQINKRFRNDISRRFRVACFSETPKNVLMWGHYTQSHRGLVLGIDPSAPGFRFGLKPGGYKIAYALNDERVRLPLAYYRGISVEVWNSAGNLTNRPDEKVEYGGGIQIEFAQYIALVEEAFLSALRTKASDWAYEREVRFIYELSHHADELLVVGQRSFVALPPIALQEIIFGSRASFNLVSQAIELFKAGKIGKPTLFYATCHPYRYEVQANETDADYLLEYYRSVKPTL